MIKIEKLDPSRWEDYKKLSLEAFTKDPLAFLTTHEEAISYPDQLWKDRLENSLKEESAITLFAFDDDEPIGMMTAHWENRDKRKHIASIVGVYVSDSQRGQGIASKIFTVLFEKIKQKKQFKKISLQVADYNEPAKKLYEKFGFEKVGFLKNELFADGKYYDDVLMELFLD